MMEMQKPVYAILLVMVIFVIIDESSENMTATEKKEMKEEVFRMFKHAYNSYMTHAYPADELMPLSCKGRYRGTEPSRGDVDETLGNFTLTLIDTLDTLVVVNEIDEFERAIKLLISDTKFDSDIVVSVFETNIRILGGLISGHVMASYLRKKRKTLDWYNDELLNMAKDVGNRLLPAFNTTTGIPYPRINLKYGITKDMSQKLHDTCTACAGSMILEFAALSRLTGEMIFEEKARKAMDYLWQQRHRSTDLMGLTINIHNGDWVRRESGVGAGIDSYYEYVYKAYILLGDDTYNDRFNTHYDAVMRYISQGPMLLDVHMHRPQASSRNFMDALLAFWPGLQVLKGDIGPAIETHEMLYQIIQKHHFLPEAFTTDFRVHWGHSPLRPEFVESTYFLYQATGDPHYLDVGKIVVQNLKERAQVPCGFASIRDVVSGSLEDQLDSFVFSETFKYLYLLFAEKEDLILNIEDYVFTTEAHLLPLSLSSTNSTVTSPKINPEVYSRYLSDQEKLEIYQEEDDDFFYVNDDPDHTCPNINIQHPRPFVYADNLRNQLKGLVQKKTVITESNKPQLKAVDFVAGNKEQVAILQRMGIRIMTMTDGRIQLLHTASEAASAADADNGMKFMQEMIELSKHQTTEVKNVPMTVQLLSAPYYGSVLYEAGPAQFGYDLRTKDPVQGKLAVTEPYKGCSGILNENELKGKLVVLERGECMFIDKARNLEKIGALGGIVIDHTEGSSVKTQPLFAMSGDGKDDVNIPMVFLFHNEGKELLDAYNSNPDMEVLLMFISKVHATVKKDEQSNIKAEEKETEPKQSEDISEDTAQNVPQMNLQPLKSYNFVDELKVAGTSFVRVAIDFGKIVLRDGDDESDVLTFDTLPEGQVITFNLDRSLLKNENSPPVTQLYESVLRVLQRETNFLDLDNKDGMLTALARLLETAWFGFNTMDEAAEQALNRLSKQLKQVPHRNVPESNILKELEMKENCREDGGEEYLKTFAGGEECKGELHDSYVKNPWLKAVPPGHKMKETQAKVDKDGVLYIVDETIPKKQTLLPPGSSSPNSRESEFNRNFDSDTHTLSSIEMPNSQDSLNTADMNQHRQESDSDININREERHLPRRNKLGIDIQTMEVHVRTSHKTVDKPNKYINNQRTSQSPDKKDLS